MRSRLTTTSIAVALAAVLSLPSPASAHTESDLVAVAAGEEATLTLKPTHGCNGSPTVEVAIQAPVTGAVAAEVEGWTATSTDDLAAGTTVLEWSGGSLPADAEGAFPVGFTVPENVGELLVFPAIQVCENGEELAWIDGDPEGEYPAPRILVLPTGTPAATSLDEVPADAPGRDQLSTIVDVDNPTAEPDPAETTSTEAVPESTAPTTESTASEAAPEPTDVTTLEVDDDDDNGSNTAIIAVAVVALVAVVAGAVYAASRRKTEG